MIEKTSKWIVGFVGFVCLLGLGCRDSGPERMPDEGQQRDMLALMLPQEIKIQPFTKVRSFNEDEIPDGILAVIRPLDKFGDPAKAVGTFYFELWSFRKASGDRKDKRLAFWERAICTADDVKRYWTRAQMYEFQLAWTGGIEGLAPDRKYVLTATYRPPWKETMEDEYVISFHVPGGLITEVGKNQSIPIKDD